MLFLKNGNSKKMERKLFRKSIITPVVWLVSLVSLFTDVASEMLYPIMPVYLKTIGFSVLLIGILEGVAEATAGLSKGYFGQISDRLGKRAPFVHWGYGLSAVSKPMMAIFSFPLWIFFARTLDRLGKGIRNSARDALLSEEATPQTKGAVFGFHRGMDTLGAAIGPLLAMVFLAFYPGQYRLLFLLAIIPGLVAVSLSLRLKDKSGSFKPKPDKPIHFFSYFSYWKRAPKSYKRLVIPLLMFTVFNSSDAFLLLHAREQLTSDTWMIGLYVFYNLIYALSSFPLGLLADKIGLKTLLIVGLSVFALVYFFFGLASVSWHFIVLFVFYGLYAASTEGVSKALITNLTDRNDLATALGLYNSLSSLCTLLASTIAGLIWWKLSPQLLFNLSGIWVALVVVLLALLTMKPKQPV